MRNRWLYLCSVRLFSLTGLQRLQLEEWRDIKLQPDQYDDLLTDIKV